MTADTGAGRLDFQWNSKVGRRYNLRCSPDLQGPSLSWSVVKGDIISSPPLNSLSISRPAESSMFYVVEEFPAPPLGRLLLLGDSHFDVHTNAATTTRGISRYANGPAIWACAELGHSIRLVDRSNGYVWGGATGVSGDLDHGYPGWTAANLLTSYDGVHFPVTHALTKEFDAVLIQCGGNDAAGAGGVTPAERVAAVGTAMKVKGKPVIITGVFPRGPVRGAVERDRIRELNADLPALCEMNGLLWLPWYTLIETDADGYATPTHIVDWSSSQVHLNSLGGQLLGAALSEFLVQHFTIGGEWTPPPVGDPRWVTPNPYLTGPVDGIPNSWRFQGPGTVVFSKFTDERGETWQEVTISGNPTYAITRLYAVQTVAGGNLTPGDTVRACCKFQGVAAGWGFKGFSLALDVYDTTNRVMQELLTNEASARNLTRSLAPFSGLMLTEPWVTTGASQVMIGLQLFGNGTFRFRQAGVIKVTP